MRKYEIYCIVLKLVDMLEEMWGVYGSMNYNVYVYVLSLWDKIW